MKRIITLLIAALLAVPAVPAQNAPLIPNALPDDDSDWQEDTENEETVDLEFNVGSFDKINATLSYKVLWVQGPATGTVQVTVNKSVADCLLVETDGEGVLKMGYKSGSRFRNPRVTATITTPSLRDITVTLSASVTADQPVMLTENLDIKASLSGIVDFPSLSAPGLDINASTSGIVKTDKTECPVIKVNSSTSASVTLLGIDADRIDASVSTSASVKLEGETVTASLSQSRETGGRLNSSGLMVKDKSSASSDTQTQVHKFREP